MRPKRIFIVGTSGSGKTTLARTISERYGYTHIEIDEIMWRPNWQKLDAFEIQSQLEKRLSEADWAVVDGNFIKYGISPAQGDQLVWLDYPRLRVLRRIIFRSLRRVTFREKLWSDNQEKLSFLLSPNPEINVVLWSWKTHPKFRVEFSALINQLDDGVNAAVIRTSRDCKRYLAGLTKL